MLDSRMITPILMILTGLLYLTIHFNLTSLDTLFIILGFLMLFTYKSSKKIKNEFALFGWIFIIIGIYLMLAVRGFVREDLLGPIFFIFLGLPFIVVYINFLYGYYVYDRASRLLPLFIGMAFISLGFLFILSIFEVVPSIIWIGFNIMWPVIIILLGFYYLLKI